MMHDQNEVFSEALASIVVLFYYYFMFFNVKIFMLPFSFKNYNLHIGHFS